MAKVITTELQHSGASGANVTLDSSKNVTCENNLQVDGALTVTGAINGSGASLTGISSPLSFRNLIINGAMQVAQRGTSSTSGNIQTVDRFRCDIGGGDENPTQAQHSLTSSDTGPWELGFRKSYHITNGNQTSGAGAADYMQVTYKPEGQDIHRSGWDHTDPNSKITLSYWIKSSVAQTFYGFIEASGPTRIFGWSTGALTANTWKKVTVTIPGYASLVIPDTNAMAFSIAFLPFYGTNYTHASNRTVGSWYEAYAYVPDNTSTWWTTNDATFEITGVQLEAGSTATDFEMRSYGDELLRCFRYCWVQGKDQTWTNFAEGIITGSTTWEGAVHMPIRMRAKPSTTFTGNSRVYDAGSSTNTSATATDSSSGSRDLVRMTATCSGASFNTGRSALFSAASDTTAACIHSAEL